MQSEDRLAGTAIALDQIQPAIPKATGLSTSEAEQRLAAEGANELPRAPRKSILAIVLELLREPMLALLLVGGGAYLLLGDTVEALILLAFATFSIIATAVQESRTEHVLEALRDLSAPRALVIRDGAQLRIAGRDVVRGDLVILEHGDRIPADARLVQATDLEVDESLLTGESLPVLKTLADDSLVYGGTMVTRGGGFAEVLATGARSKIGGIGESLSMIEAEQPRLRAETKRIVRLCGIGGLLVALSVVLLLGVLRGGWIEAILAGIATGMSMLPEEFLVVLTIFLAMGAARIAKVGVLTRRATAIETLGSATILCSDKTGTLTENHMEVAKLWLPDGELLSATDLGGSAPPVHDLLEISRLASAPEPVDPMERAFHRAALKIPGLVDRSAGWNLLHSYGLQDSLMAMSNIWCAPEGRDGIVAAKGAPEAIVKLCRLGVDKRRIILEAVDRMAAEGMRVLAVARAAVPSDRWPATQQEHDFTFMGLIGLADPIRREVPAAIAKCRRAGIRVLMITGDHAATARAIAGQAGIDSSRVLTGTEIACLDDLRLAEHLRSTSVFARVLPEQKLRIVNALACMGEIVAMTGDGVNDAPSLKAAHIGIAMGGRGTDVAREAADIVLLDDNFASIVAAIGLGRRIFDNIRKAAGFIFAVHVPIAGLALLPLVTGLPVLFGPIHIALLEMVIDPVCALAFEAEGEETGIMERPPRNPEERLFSRGMIGQGVLQGLTAFALLSVLFLGGAHLDVPENDLRGIVFLALVGSIVAMILANRSFGASLKQAFIQRNHILHLILAGVVTSTAMILLIKPLRDLLQFGSWWHAQLGSALAATGLVLVVLERIKRVATQFQQRAIFGRS